MIYVIENEVPLFKLMVWGLRQEGYDVISVPKPSEAERFGERLPSHVIINCDFAPEECRAVVEGVRTQAPGALVLDLGKHDLAICGADAELSDPYQVSDIIAWMKSASKSLRR